MKSFIDKHILADVTELFRELERQPAHTSLHAKAKRLSAPFLDYEAAARAAGWTVSEAGLHFVNSTTRVLRLSAGDSWKPLCDLDEIPPHEIPIIGHYFVTAELADKLSALGERVERDFGGNIVWARKKPNEKWIDDDGDYPLDVDPVLVSIFNDGGW